MKVVEYGRISTDKQTLEQQNRTVQEWLKRNGLKSDIVITEEGISGGVTYKKRKLGTDVLPLLETGDMLIVAEISRLGRSMGDINKLINDELKPRKIRLVIVQMNLDLNCGNMKAIDEMILYAFSFGAAVERELIQERTRSALAVKKQKIKEEGGFYSKSGNWCTSLGGTTTGQTKGGKVNGEKRRKEAMNDEKNNMIAAMLEGCNTPQDIDKVVERLNARGIRTHSGLEFTRNRLTALRTKINRRAEYAQSVLSE
jgi:DNA invertase Pin-like site-specific DNA recombinase|nr:MAG TPA_asm: integrase [Caudoviricetes sp.]